MSKNVLAAIVAVSSLMPAIVEAQPILWEGNGHYYELIDDLGITWSDAKVEAETLSFEGLQGHLVVITSPEEQQFLTDNFSSGNNIGNRRLGGFQPEGSPEPDGGWTWVTGEPWEYTNWHGGGPNNAPNEEGQGEDTLVTWGTGPGEWNDEHDVWGDCKGYVVEYGIPFDPCPDSNIINVPGDFSTIQAAIANSSDCDEIIVAPGTYPEVINFNGKAITLRSSDGPDVTIIDGTGLNNTVVKCISGEGLDTVLDGFTITGGVSFLGGGMFNANSSPTVANCTFTGNLVTGTGAGLYNATGSSPMILGCRFSENVADMSGGGMGNDGDASPTILHSHFVNNVAADHGGGIFTASNSNPTIINCIFAGNEATNRGGSIVTFDTAHTTVIGCSFSENSAAEGGGISNLNNASSTISNSIFWANVPDQLTGNATATYSTVQGGWPGTGNIDADPLFIDPDNGDYRLGSCSPATDAGDNDAIPVEIKTDLDGNPRFVDDGGRADTGNGSPPIVDMGAFERQVDTAFTTHIVSPGQSIQSAIDDATDCDEVVVAPGTYNEVINFIGKAITLRSSDGADVTIIDGTGLNNSVVKCISGEGADTVLEGFTITNGTGDPSVNPGSTVGGGMRIQDSSPWIEDCIFDSNTAQGVAPLSGDGGGVYAQGGAPSFIRCIFQNNVAERSGGGAIHISGIATYVSCIFRANSAGDFGGGAYLAGSFDIQFLNDVFFGNFAHLSDTGQGGGIGTQGDFGDLLIANCTFFANGPHAIYNDHFGPTTIVNSVSWGSLSGTEFALLNGEQATVTYSDVAGGWPGEGNIDEDPLFIDPDNGDLHISSDSPCIDVGDNSVVEPDAVDIDGEERIQNGVVDMGADEFNFCLADLSGDGVVSAFDLALLLGSWGPCPEPPADCPADIHGDGDGIVKADDLAFLLGNWGPCD